MAFIINLQNHSFTFIVVCFISLLFANHGLCLSSPEVVANGGGFAPALATWYGDPHGSGSGGACGWGDDVKLPPFSSMIAAGNAKIFLQGKGCGQCYQVKCNREHYCSGNPITVTISDECPGTCNNVPFHFDLSGIAFGAMANLGQADNLRNLGQVDIQFQRVPCNYGRTKIAFKIDTRTNSNWFAMTIEFVDGDGGLKSVEVAPAGLQEFLPMNNIWGAVWSLNVNPSFKGPLSFRLTSLTRAVIIARNTVPFGFVSGRTYFSDVNF